MKSLQLYLITSGLILVLAACKSTSTTNSNVRTSNGSTTVNNGSTTTATSTGGGAHMHRYRATWRGGGGPRRRAKFRTISCPSFGKTGSYIANGSTISNTDNSNGEKISKEDFLGITDSTGVKDSSGTEEYSKIVENKFEETKSNHVSTFSIDVDRASYTNVRRMINDKQMPPADAIRLEEMINYFEYDYPQPQDEHPFSINLENASCPWNPNHQLVLVGLQGKNFDEKQYPPSNLVFLLDVSGSMQYENKLPLVKTTMRLLVEQLRPEDKVTIVVYAGAAGLVLPTTSGDKKGEILAAIDKLEAGGSTAGGEGIKLAYKIAGENLMQNGNNRVILCTDGDFNVGVSSENELQKLIESERDKGIYLTVLGYGYGNYKDNKLEILADKGNGNYGYIDSKEEAKKMLVEEMAGTLFTIAKDVKIQVEFDSTVVKSYRLLGYENRILEDWEFDDDTRDAGEIGAGHTVTAIYEVELVDPSLMNPANYDMVTNSMHHVMSFKFRYKKPGDENSILMTQELIYKQQAFENASENLRFASAVAAFGMVLRNSAYKGTADMDMVLDMARKAQTKDAKGYKAQFMDLVRASKGLMVAAK